MQLEARAEPGKVGKALGGGRVGMTRDCALRNTRVEAGSLADATGSRFTSTRFLLHPYSFLHLICLPSESYRKRLFF